MAVKTLPHPVRVTPGQVWQSNDHRDRGRRVIIDDVRDQDYRYAYCVGSSGRRTRIRVRSRYPGGIVGDGFEYLSGYELIAESGSTRHLRGH